MADARSALIEAVAAEFGVEPLEADEVDAILELAGAAAHGTGDRTAAPLCCYIAGLASSPEARLGTLQEMHEYVSTVRAPVEGAS